jgi:hypothetical protein
MDGSPKDGNAVVQVAQAVAATRGLFCCHQTASWTIDARQRGQPRFSSSAILCQSTLLPVARASVDERRVLQRLLKRSSTPDQSANSGGNGSIGAG